MIARTVLLAALLLSGAPSMVRLADAARAVPGQERVPSQLDPNSEATRSLSDADLYALLLRMSATSQAVTERIVRCHPFGVPGWRECVSGVR